MPVDDFATLRSRRLHNLWRELRALSERIDEVVVELLQIDPCRSIGPWRDPRQLDLPLQDRTRKEAR